MDSKKRILVIGDIMLDTYHFGRVDRISPEAPVPVFLETGKEQYVPGGASNAAANIAATGVPVDICAAVGDDAVGNRLIALVHAQKVGGELIHKIPGRRTTHKLRYIGPNNQQLLRVDTEDTEEINSELAEQIVQSIRLVINRYSLFLISDYLKGFLSEKLIQGLIGLAKETDIPVLVDVKGTHYKKYRGAALLKPNRKELSDLTGMDTRTVEAVAEAAKLLCREAECQYVLTTLGAEGMLLTDAWSVLKEVKSTAKEVYDVAGAGDTSIAYLAAALFSGKSIMEAVKIANYAAGVQVSKVGTGVVTLQEVCNAVEGRRGDESFSKCLDFYEEDGLVSIHQLAKAGMRIVFSNGCFDVLHSGHIAYLKQAKKLGDILVIGVNSDTSVRRLKGEERPINSLRDRILLLCELECVDYVVPFEEDTPYKLIQTIQPDVLVKGGDYTLDAIVGADIVIKNGGTVKVLPFVEGKSTTNILKQMKGVADGHHNSQNTGEH